MMKYFPQWTEDYILWELTWENLVMYMAHIPDYSSKKLEGGSTPPPANEAQRQAEQFGF